MHSIDSIDKYEVSNLQLANLSALQGSNSHLGKDEILDPSEKVGFSNGKSSINGGSTRKTTYRWSMFQPAVFDYWRVNVLKLPTLHGVRP